MKKLLILSFVLSGLLFAHLVSAEEITNWQTVIQINADSSINVEEKIDYDFGDLQKHGIYRDIPIRYKARGGNYNLRISDIHVTDENNKSYNFNVSRSGENINLKIGDADTLITGSHTYLISYTIKRAINYFTEYDELYWNVTGNEWPVSIKQSQVIISLPQPIADKKLQEKCFMGYQGDTTPCTISHFEYAKNNLVSDIIFNQDELLTGQGLTVVVGLPKGVLAEPTLQQQIMYILWDNWVLVLPFITFLACFYIWYTRGRDPKGRGTIIAEYDPPADLSPAEVGTIYDEKAQKKDISAEIINLAIKGYFRINRLETGKYFKSSDYEFTKLKNADGKLTDVETSIMSGFFGETKNLVKLSDLKDKFYSDFEAMVKNVYSAVVDKGYFVNDPHKAGNPFLITGIGLIFFVIMFSGLVVMISGTYLIISAVISGLIMVIFSIFMPQKTVKGAKTREHILGLREYLSVAEKDRIKFHNAPEKNPQEFEKLLPYAMVLGVEQQWAKQFEDVYTNQNPSWYTDQSLNNFNASLLANRLGNFQSSSISNLTSKPSSSSSGSGGGFSGFSSGGGFSGGGFGGGGGGSW